jgi:hypothetical protein
MEDSGPLFAFTVILMRKKGIAAKKGHTFSSYPYTMVIILQFDRI